MISYARTDSIHDARGYYFNIDYIISIEVVDVGRAEKNIKYPAPRRRRSSTAFLARYLWRVPDRRVGER